MQTTIEQSYLNSLEHREARTSIWSRFINWADDQEKNRFGWTAGIIAGHGCVFTVITVMAIVFTGNHFILCSHDFLPSC